MKRAVIVYQAGIANVFEVGEHASAYSDRVSTKRLYQGDFRTAAAYARGLQAAGVDVRTACCNQAGDIARSVWNSNYDLAPFHDQFILIGGVL